MTSTEFLRQTINSLADADEFNAVTVHLFTNDFEIPPTVVPGDFDEADFTGYAEADANKVGVAWDDSNGNAILSFVGVHFQPTASTVTNVVVGWWAQANVDGSGPCVIACGKFPSPVTMAGVADAIDMVPLVAIGNTIGTVGA